MEHKILQTAYGFCYDGKKLSLNGAKNVDRFSDKEILVSLEDRGLLIKGNNLAMEELSTAGGTLNVTGEVLSIVSTRASDKSSLFKKLFK